MQRVPPVRPRWPQRLAAPRARGHRACKLLHINVLSKCGRFFRGSYEVPAAELTGRSVVRRLLTDVQRPVNAASTDGPVSVVAAAQPERSRRWHPRGGHR